MGIKLVEPLSTLGEGALDRPCRVSDFADVRSSGTSNAGQSRPYGPTRCLASCYGEVQARESSDSHCFKISFFVL